VSFDVYVQYFAAGQPAGIDEARVRGAFAEARIEDVDDDYWILHFDDDDATTDLFLGPHPLDPARVHGVSLHRPARAQALWDGIWRLLDAPGAVFHFPGVHAPLVRDPGAAAALPPDLRAALGAPVQAQSAQALLDALDLASGE
jgi:hypothetical protein